MGYEYSMNVFICGNLTKENKDIINKIFKEKGSKSYTEFEQRDFDFEIILSYNTSLKYYKFYYVVHLFNQRFSAHLI